MHTFVSADAAFAEACKDLVLNGEDVEIATAEQGSQSTIELLNYGIVFEPWHNPIIENPVRHFPKRGAQAEFLWYMTGCNDASAVTPYLKNWSRFANDEGKVNSNYGCYWKDGIKWCIEELKRDKYSRRAVMNIYAHGNRPFGKDTPCTLSLQFFIRRNRLHLICNMRSNDVWYGFCIDQYCNTMLHRLVLAELQLAYGDLTLGYYYHNAASMHAYSNVAPCSTLHAVVYHQQDRNGNENNDYMLANVRFSNFWLAGKDLFDADIFEHFKAIAEQAGNVNLIK